ncbi:MAG: MBL fold metallo-hydrolase [Sphaerochaetaceae bacterium]|nr:MBL fold metallo-hydrolase [Sphaerochaetaceae bacterium]
MEIERLAVGIFRTNCYLLHDTQRVWIIDPGDQGEMIRQIISERGWTVQSILLTHGHFDHILAVPYLHRHYPEAEIMIHREDSSALGETAYDTMVSFIRHVDVQLLQHVNDITEFPSPTVLLEDGQLIGGCNLRVLFTPGHSRGSIGFYNEEEGILFSGDTLFYHTIGRTDLPFADYDVLIDSIHKKLLPLNKEVNVYPGHGKVTTIGDELKSNPFLS